MTRTEYQDMSTGYSPLRLATPSGTGEAVATCRFCGEDIHLAVDPTGQRGTAWADESFPVAPGDDRAFQCVFSEDGQHSPEAKS